jgi:hypothetical protein
MWDGRSFAAAFRSGREEGQPYLVLSQGAWTCMRSVRWDRYICLRTYHDGWLDLSPLMLFDIEVDPHQQHNLSSEQPALTDHALALLTGWQAEMMQQSSYDVDPLMTVLRQGGPWQLQGHNEEYLERLRTTGRVEAARRLQRK